MSKLKITDLPDRAAYMAKSFITADGEVKDEQKAFSAIADYLILIEEPELIYDISDFVCFGCNNSEIAGITDKAYELCRDDTGDFSEAMRRALIEKSLFECANESDEINFEGFARFRLREYKELLYSLCEEAAGEYFADREYKRITGLLREYVGDNIRTDEVHIYGFYVFDGDGNDVTMDEKKLLDTNRYIMTDSDRLVGTLISLCPERVYIHGAPDEETLRTIETIFAPNVIYSNES